MVHLQCVRTALLTSSSSPSSSIIVNRHHRRGVPSYLPREGPSSMNPMRSIVARSPGPSPAPAPPASQDDKNNGLMRLF